MQFNTYTYAAAGAGRIEVMPSQVALALAAKDNVPGDGLGRLGEASSHVPMLPPRRIMCASPLYLRFGQPLPCSAALP